MPAVLEPRAHFTRKVRFPGSGAGPGGLAYLVHQARTNGNPFPHALDRGAEPPFRAKTLPPAVLFFVGRIDAVEFAQQRRPIELVGVVASGGAGIGADVAGADHRLRQRVERGA